MTDAITTKKYYQDDLNLRDIEALENRLVELVDTEIQSVVDLEQWLVQERKLGEMIQEALSGHQIDFYRDTASETKRGVHTHDQLVVRPLLLKYEASFNKKFCECPFTSQLDERRYGLMHRIRRSKLELFREENIALMVRENELATKYLEIMGGLTVQWGQETQSYPFVQAKLDHPNRNVRERAWRALAQARERVKGEMNQILDELVQIRHQIAVNAGFQNYRDYIFKEKNREYSVEDCFEFHASVEKHVIPAWNSLNRIFQNQMGIETLRPWDTGSCSLQGAPFESDTELMDGVQSMLGRTDSYFEERFRWMRNHGLLDLEGRHGKGPGGFMSMLPTSKNTFVFANFSPSFFAVIALIHEMGHAINFYLQFGTEAGYQGYNLRAEVAELYSHGMELLLLDKLDAFYAEESIRKIAQLEELRRSLRMLVGPLAGDAFQHWMYTHPNHTAEERETKYLEIQSRFGGSAVDISGCEYGMATLWFVEPHTTAYPFYSIEYSMSELGALQLLEIYKEDSSRAIALYKQGAGTDMNQSIAEIYQDTGVKFDFSEAVIEKTAQFVGTLVRDLVS